MATSRSCCSRLMCSAMAASRSIGVRRPTASTIGDRWRPSTLVDDAGKVTVPPGALELGRRDKATGAVQPTVVVPAHPAGRCQLEIGSGPPRAVRADELGLVQAV